VKPVIAMSLAMELFEVCKVVVEARNGHTPSEGKGRCSSSVGISYSECFEPGHMIDAPEPALRVQFSGSARRPA
jgi:hypothetical protein